MIGCFKTRMLQEAGTVGEIRTRLRKACDGGDMRGSTDGCINLACFERGNENHAEAERLFRRACDAGDRDACDALP